MPSALVWRATLLVWRAKGGGYSCFLWRRRHASRYVSRHARPRRAQAGFWDAAESNQYPAIPRVKSLGTVGTRAPMNTQCAHAKDDLTAMREHIESLPCVLSGLPIIAAMWVEDGRSGLYRSGAAKASDNPHPRLSAS